MYYLLKYDYHHNETTECDVQYNILRVCLFPVQLENFIQENVRSGMEEMKSTAVHTQTAAMLEMGTNLLSQSAEQTRKLTDVETQVLNQTSRLEIQLLEYSLFTNRLEKHILLQTQEISRLSDKNR
ncbi:Angiopoietin-2 [Liparis tanakae]|uniref:Angiopoietin-2 n=1 Tax=Liparis tanakae TaxID=230148 RepID=A0A4Z2JCV0_9TELE|nr:Angiopoietin-2 [Liparis tanakae]